MEKNHTRYAVLTDKGFIQRKGSSHFGKAGFEKADLYISEYHAGRSAHRHRGKVVEVNVSLKVVTPDEV